jgi:glycerate-2-kinase
VADKRAVTDALSRRGADIRQLNAVRKHLSRIKGGRLAMAGSPQALVSLILSDVVGNPLDVIASGPTAPDPTTFADALDVLTSLGVMHTAPMAVCRHLEMGAGGAFEETPKALPANVHNLIVGDNDMALAAAAQAAEKRGYRVVNLGSRIEGESRDVGRQLAQKALAIRDRRDPVAPPACLLSGGETIVSHVKTGGKGGRNQELALAFLEELRTDGLRGVTLLSAGTDGEDGPTDAAGAWADAETLARARQKSLEPHEFLKSNRSYLFFEAVHSLLRTGPTHTNVMDLRVILIR